VTWIREELGLEQTIFFAELMWVSSQCGSPDSCRDACASTRRGATQRAGGTAASVGFLLFQVAVISL